MFALLTSHLPRQSRKEIRRSPSARAFSTKNKPTTTSTSTSASHQRRFKSASAKPVLDRPGFYPVYVHHVSKIALEHLQGERSDWVMQQGLDSGLTINPNGTFVLSFPPDVDQEAGKIWTSYDSDRKQHWLSVRRPNLAIQFLLKSHGTRGGVNHDSKTMDEQISQAVDQMIATLTQMDESSSSSPQASDDRE